MTETEAAQGAMMKAHQLRILALAVVALMCAGPASGGDDAPLKPKHQLALPFTEGGLFAHGGWTGLSPKGNYCAAYYSVKRRAYVALWDVERGKLIDKLEVGEGWIKTDYGSPAAFTPAGTHLAYLTPGQANFHPLTPDQKAQTVPVPKRLWVRVEPEISLLIVGGKEVQQLMYSTADWHFWRDRCEAGPALKVIETDEVTTRPVALGAAVSADGTQLAWVQGPDIFNPAPQACPVHVRDFGTGKAVKLTRAKGGNAGCTALGFSADGKWLGCGHNDGSLTVWDLAKAKEVLSIFLPEPGRSVGAVAFSPDGKYVACGSFEKQGVPNVRIVSLKTQKTRWAWADSPAAVLHLCWNAKGTQLGVFGQNSLTIYDVPEEEK